MTKIKCVHCAKRFEPKRSWQRFCSARCQQQAWRAKKVIHVNLTTDERLLEILTENAPFRQRVQEALDQLAN